MHSIPETASEHYCHYLGQVYKMPVTLYIPISAFIYMFRYCSCDAGLQSFDSKSTALGFQAKNKDSPAAEEAVDAHLKQLQIHDAG